MAYLPEGYKDSRRKVRHYGVASSGEIARQGEVEQWEHWDGRVDAVVKPRPIGIRLVADAPPNDELVRAVADMEAAGRNLKWARASGDPVWVRAAQAHFDATKARVERLS